MGAFHVRLQLLNLQHRAVSCFPLLHVMVCTNQMKVASCNLLHLGINACSASSELKLFECSLTSQCEPGKVQICARHSSCVTQQTPLLVHYIQYLSNIPHNQSTSMTHRPCVLCLHVRDLRVWSSCACMMT